jgi:hypothetical protein
MTAAKRPRAKQDWRVFPAPDEGFAPYEASARELTKHGLPQRPETRADPHLAGLWDVVAGRYSGFTHLSPDFEGSGPAKAPIVASLSPIENCGFSIPTTGSAPFTALFIHWTVPHLVYTPAPLNKNWFHTFAGIGYLADVHVEMTVDSAGVVTSTATVNGSPVTNLPVVPGDAMSAVMCVNTQSSGGPKVFIGVANETRGQTVNLSTTAPNLPALSVDAGVTLDLVQNNPTLNKLARFGVVYFDEISAYTTHGPRTLAVGTGTTMTDLSGKAMAHAYRLNDFAFKTVYG